VVTAAKKYFWRHVWPETSIIPQVTVNQMKKGSLKKERDFEKSFLHETSPKI
jgi:hypothetical protein